MEGNMARLPRYRRTITMAALTAVASAAPAAAPVRTILQQTELPSQPAQAATLGTVALKAGEEVAWHVHAGIEIGYVQSGSIVLSAGGMPDRTFAAGQSFVVPRGIAHRSRPVGGDARLVVTWITDAGGEISTPVDAPR
jgi:quercetin dioxygenase-like cupin family protein